ncbi:MAG: hypothetical protein KJT03_04235 [Verrucomicrobiae bacterium]|nr:hypothetical protein [Bdellovibrionales bacterium]MCB1120732.1 hypothetical protein [Verrucomicrobiae bacterium]
MEFSDAEKATIGQWVSEGLKLSEIQSRIHQEFGRSLTYMDVKFLIDDLELELKEQPKAVESDLRKVPPPESSPPGEDEFSEGPSLGGGVSVNLHRLYKPGALVSGDVVFSDGEKAEWSLDQIGRLGLNPSTDGYKPSEVDLRDFQQKLSSLLQGQGF